MSFYDLSKNERTELVEVINRELLAEIKSGKLKKTLLRFSDEDTYIRKSAYLSVGRIYLANVNMQGKVISILRILLKEEDFKIRQTAINAAGEIGKTDFDVVEQFFDMGLFDEHHSVRNAVIGSMKKMGEKNPQPVLLWAKRHLHHENKEIRREICHGIELRGRTHPQDILPMLKELQFDKTARVRNTLVHVLGQIAYKEGCLATVVEHLKSWENKELITEALEEIIDVHDRYRNFSILTQEQAMDYIHKHFRLKPNR
jgi:HEAT repeat protein